MERSSMLPLTLAGVVFLISALYIVSHLTQAADIWWTPKQLSPSLSDVADRVEVYLREDRIEKLIASGRLQLLGAESPTTVMASDIRFRFNNMDRVRAQEIPALLTSAALLGASGLGLLSGIVGRIRARKVLPAA